MPDILFFESTPFTIQTFHQGTKRRRSRPGCRSRLLRFFPLECNAKPFAAWLKPYAFPCPEAERFQGQVNINSQEEASRMRPSRNWPGKA
jgi:hypothetical protein